MGTLNPPHNYTMLSFLSASDVQSQMNSMGSQRIPFLFAVNFEMTDGFIIPHPLTTKDVYWSIGAMGNPIIPQPKGSRFTAHPISAECYKAKFDTAYKGLMRGDSFLLNLTVSTPIEMDHTLESIFENSHATYKLCVPNHFVCFSLETFVRIQDNCIASFPMKGTIDAAIPDAEKVILQNYKETAEHCTIVDLIRNDLNQIARNVHVKRFRYIDRLHTNKGELLQVSSEVCGHLDNNWHTHIGDILFQLLPAGSISGAPKPSTLSIIQRSEGEKRGYYTGIFGLYDGQSLESAVMIRFIEKRNGQFFFRSGGGITINSDWKSEYDEVLQKVYLPFL